MSSAIYISVVVVATAGLVYELLAAAAASYLLGDSVTQFSTVIGTYLFAMGIGSYLSRYIHRGVAARFVEIEIAVGLLAAPPLIFWWRQWRFEQRRWEESDHPPAGSSSGDDE